MSIENYHLIPLVLNGQLSDTYNNYENLLLWRTLEQELNAKLIKLEDLKEIKPILFLVYLDEVNPDINEDIYEKIYTIPWSASIFFIKKSSDHRLYKLRIEEEYLLNFTKEFLLYDSKLSPSIFVPQIVYFSNKQLSKFKSLNIDTFDVINSCLNKNQIFLNSFLRIFREDSSATSFFAAIEFILMLQHFFLLLDIAILENFYRVENQEKTNFLNLNTGYVTDGKIYGFLNRIQENLQNESITYKFLQSPMDKYSSSLFQKVIELHGIEHNFVGNSRNWINFVDAMIQIRNKTKGHGTVYDISEIQKILIELCSNFLYNIPEIEIEGLKSKPYMTFIDVKDIFKNELTQNRLRVRFNSRDFEIYPYILYSENYGMFLYGGRTINDQGKIYKNYSQGINLLI